MGLLTAVGLLPHLLFSLPAGVWLDRITRRRRLMVIADLIRAGVIALVPLAFVLNVLSIELLFVLTFVVGTVAVFFDLAWLTLVTAVARREQLVEGNAMLNASRSVSGRRRAGDRRRPHPGPVGADRAARRRGVVPRLGPVPEPRSRA